MCIRLGGCCRAVRQHIFYALSYVAMPGFWAETLISQMLGLNSQTSFRMFPPADIVHGFDTSIAYSNALMIIMCIPYFQASPSMQFCIMLARFMIDHGKWKLAWRVGNLIMIL
ncbi:hypothetical protein BBK36DRAFT_1181333 [Trichoderma citrinoviride]|uniref:Uncharacterized protein n=1 Tax=Trichoderma citrinoviride TaxID=58853 RepID=A0A2T4B3X9_9HYPO|nr:hypothetical protein BBK36DRAFT_1181333 [Trichoderma citrinoviride]PTB64034.1 hypothetical protein BBK36DRAFT_1181333 [Trichoderma citrinoviride]